MEISHKYLAISAVLKLSCVNLKWKKNVLEFDVKKGGIFWIFVDVV